MILDPISHAPRRGRPRRGVRLLGIGLVAVVMAAGAACSDARSSEGRTDGIAVAASFYPLAWIAEQVGGNDVSVVDLTTPGQEPHDVELTARGRSAMEQAAVVIVVGGGFQPAIESVASEVDATTIVALDLVTPDGHDEASHEDHEDHEDHDHDDHGHTAHDGHDHPAIVHFWLDPTRLIPVVDAVRDALADAAPDAAPEFAARAQTLVDELEALDSEFAQGLAACDGDLIITNHDAFGALAERYGFTVESISGLSPDAEPSPARLAELTELAAEHDVTTIFTETLVSPAVAESLAAEAGLDTAVLDPLEGLTAAQRTDGDDYFSVMRANLAALRAGLGCHR